MTSGCAQRAGSRSGTTSTRPYAASRRPESTPEIARLLVTHGSALLAQGSVDAVLQAIEPLAPELRGPGIEQLAGEAFQIRGNWDEALRCFERAAGDSEVLAPALAWRMGLLRHLEGRLDDAVAIYESAGEEGEPRDVALLLAWRGERSLAARGGRGMSRRRKPRIRDRLGVGRPARARRGAHRARDARRARGRPGANDAHYLRALDYAQQAGDVLQLIRVRTNRGSRHLEEGAYEEAIAELDLALRLADLAGYASFRALALTNRGEAHARLARFEEAVADLEDARSLYQRLGSRMVSYPLEKLGQIYRERGDWTLARAAYEEAVAQSEPAGDLQGLIPALAGLARVLVVDEPDKAEQIAEKALALGPGMAHAHALLVGGLGRARARRPRAR